MEDNNEVRVFGPPGTGKTTWMASSVRATARKRGSSKIVVGSFTRAAATEIAGRGLPLDRGNVGTLHALAYRAIGRPDVAGSKEIAEWNRLRPQWALSGSGGGNTLDEAQDGTRGSTDADRLAAEADRYRAMRLPLEAWPNALARRFHIDWTEWKRSEELVDFTDMVELALETTDTAPGEPEVGCFDEAQDFTPLELALVRHWGRSMDRLILAGDDDQNLYAFKGATPEGFLDPPIPEDDKRLLAQSYRVPEAVHTVAQRWVETLSRREPKDYHPREGDKGSVRLAELSYERPIPLLAEVLRDIEDGRTVMVLTTCAYMLDPLKRLMRAEGVPFHNPYRRSRADWSPLWSREGTTSSAERLASYLIADERIFGDRSRFWTGGDVRRWSNGLRKKGILVRGAGKLIEQLPDRELTYDEVTSLFDPTLPLEELGRALDPDLGWYTGNLTASTRSRMDYPIAVARRDPIALVEEPRLVIGTIHSVKGAEADVVYLFPDLSFGGAREWNDEARRDTIVRQFYVGMTRARQDLVLCRPSSPASVDPGLWV